jgi:hypothetical protein
LGEITDTLLRFPDEKISPDDTLYAVIEKGGSYNDPRISSKWGDESQGREVVKDSNDPRGYAYESARRTHVHLINASVWRYVLHEKLLYSVSWLNISWID